VSSVANSICLLDDESPTLKALGRLLASEGLTTEKFTEPARFLAYARSHLVSLAVIDVQMPGMCGFDVLLALRGIHPASRAIIITALDDPAHRTAAMAAGASAFFLKPFNGDAFIEAIRSALASAAGHSGSTAT